jgi:hypothetical protein
MGIVGDAALNAGIENGLRRYVDPEMGYDILFAFTSKLSHPNFGST